MKVVTDAIYDLLSNDAGLTAAATSGVFANEADSNIAPPFVVYATSVNPGPCRGEGSFVTGEILIECVTDIYEELQTLKQAVRDVLDDAEINTVLDGKTVVLSFDQLGEGMDENPSDENLKVLRGNFFGTINN